MTEVYNQAIDIAGHSVHTTLVLVIKHVSNQGTYTSLSMIIIPDSYDFMTIFFYIFFFHTHNLYPSFRITLSRHSCKTGHQSDHKTLSGNIVLRVLQDVTAAWRCLRVDGLSVCAVDAIARVAGAVDYSLRRAVCGQYFVSQSMK